MLVVMELGATKEMVDNICHEIEKAGLKAHPMPGAVRTAIGVTGNKAQIDADHLEAQLGVKEIIHVTKPFKLVSREFYPEDSVIDVSGVLIGGKNLVVMAGPCAVESREQCMIIAEHVAAAGAQIFRGGAYKPRTSPYSFQGLAEDGLKILAEVREKFGMVIITEAIDTDVLPMVSEYTDIIQIGARNMQNYSLLKKAGRQSKPVMLKRGMSATLEEFLMAAEYIMSEGNGNIILCERGVRTFADHTRNTLDLSAVPYVKRTSHLPIIVDPSHGTGKAHKVLPLSRAAIATGCDGLMIEVHHDPANAMSDGPQSLTPDKFENLMKEITAIGAVLGRTCE